MQMQHQQGLLGVVGLDNLAHPQQVQQQHQQDLPVSAAAGAAAGAPWVHQETHGVRAHELAFNGPAMSLQLLTGDSLDIQEVDTVGSLSVSLAEELHQHSAPGMMDIRMFGTSQQQQQLSSMDPRFLSASGLPPTGWALGNASLEQQIAQRQQQQIAQQVLEESQAHLLYSSNSGALGSLKGSTSAGGGVPIPYRGSAAVWSGSVGPLQHVGTPDSPSK
jgi:hypothetical protein